MKELRVCESSYPKRSESVTFKIWNNETVVLNLDSRSYYSLNDVGTSIWKLCDGSKNIGRLTSIICSEYNVSEEKAKKDILELIRDLAKERLITILEKSCSSTKEKEG